MNAGGDYLREQIAVCRSLTDKPFGVNIMLMSPHVAEVAQIVAEEKVPVVTTGAGNPTAYMSAWLEAGIKVIPVVASVASAKMSARAGAAALIAEGMESGGHIGELTTMVLVPQVCDAVSIPVVAAGGIADGRGVAASIMLGAVGVQLGTRFLVAEECGVHQVYKDKVLEATDISTVMTAVASAIPAAASRMRSHAISSKLSSPLRATAEQVSGAGRWGASPRCHRGDAKNGCFLAGQCAGMVKKEQPAAEIIREICDEAEKLLNR